MAGQGEISILTHLQRGLFFGSHYSFGRKEVSEEILDALFMDHGSHKADKSGQRTLATAHPATWSGKSCKLRRGGLAQPELLRPAILRRLAVLHTICSYRGLHLYHRPFWNHDGKLSMLNSIFFELGMWSNVLTPNTSLYGCVLNFAREGYSSCKSHRAVSTYW